MLNSHGFFLNLIIYLIIMSLKTFSKSAFAYLSCFVLCLFFSKFAYAAIDADQNGLMATMCNVVRFITGGVGKSIAVIAVVVIGVSFFMGKVSWGTALATVAGIGIVFGAATIVQVISGSQKSACKTGTAQTDVSAVSTGSTAPSNTL